MKLAALSAMLLLSACANYDVARFQNHTAEVVTRADPAAEMMLKCDALGFYRGSGDHRLCVMRSVDRLGIGTREVYNLHQSPSMSHVPLIPYAYPPLSPHRGTVIIK